MLNPRIIPTLLIHNEGVYKTTRFKDPKYIGDPINVVRIFNEKYVDEIMVLDIDATVKGKEPNYGLIEKIASECRMPLCYGGGIKNKDQASRIFDLGVEKVAFGSLTLESPEILSEVSEEVGSQSVVAVLDVKKSTFSGYHLRTCNGEKKSNIDIFKFVAGLKDIGVGELVINSIDKEGTMSGYDLDLVRKIRENTNLPLTIIGGAGSYNDIKELINEFGIIGVAAGSLFVFRGKFRAVLINYPTIEQKREIFQQLTK
ncbi:AglZ/HisF2 family acetamidino modification protein [Balneola vulgaris]|uniref:AglZ/HisF2 family acetamidino modification protein n=1 Tax=Balneola vulgaris TaxID=287535 RepID=UPI000364D0C9|nr:AglZ/HisF2 family acetamidino modification protein [Balneola vulgaris]